MNRQLARALVRVRRLIPLLLVCGFLSGCTVGWESTVHLRPNKNILPTGVVAVVSKMKNVAVVSPAAKNLPADSVLQSIQVKRQDVVAIVMFPTAAGLKDQVTSIIIGTQSKSLDGKAFVKDLSDTLQKKYGDSSTPPRAVRSMSQPEQ
jgi:hypothetical protein